MKKYTFSTSLSSDECMSYIRNETEPEKWISILFNHKPGELYLMEKNSHFELYIFGKGTKEIRPTFYGKTFRSDEKTTIKGYFKFANEIYVVCWALIVLGSLIGREVLLNTNDPKYCIIPFVLSTGSIIALARMKFGKQAAKAELKEKVFLLLENLQNQRVDLTR